LSAKSRIVCEARRTEREYLEQLRSSDRKAMKLRSGKPLIYGRMLCSFEVLVPRMDDWVEMKAFAFSRNVEIHLKHFKSWTSYGSNTPLY
jgi:hypothetical protein